METTLAFNSDNKDKIQLLISLANEMGLTVHDQSGQKMNKAEESSTEYGNNQKLFKNLYLLQSLSQQKINLLINVAKEIGIQLIPVSSDQLENIFLAQQSLSQEWNAPENDHWDEFLSTHKIE